ncbi:GntR family transcriptional regulator [Streptomyces sp. FXJ7.023]|uniref:GntR family transcriptional regulator n=1 Tax=Streptomyces sp. FXJ7.023 TaxID=579932 RepID=UPI001F36AAA8|nr:UTRA domain-containing protein [Streptomyces sp. FXJ7.023]
MVLPKYGHGLDRLTGLAEELTGRGTVTNEVRVAEEVPVLPAAIAARLEVPAGAGGVRGARARPGRTVLTGDLAAWDVFGLIEEAAGVRLGRAEVTVHAVGADPDTAGLLGIGAGAAVFALERLTRLADGRPVDVESVRVRADRMTLRATLYRDGPRATA